MLISRKGTERSITQLNVSNSCYVLDQQGNYMFRLLEAIFRLHKINLEDKEYNIYIYIYIYIYYAQRCINVEILALLRVGLVH